MHAFPHHYLVAAAATTVGDVELTADRVVTLESASPAEFDGPGDRWSPETLLTAALADCFVLTFRGVARASKLPWTSLRCEATGTLDRIDRATQFTGFDLHAHLVVPPGTDLEAARRVLDKAEHSCLIANSLKGGVRLTPVVEVVGEAVPA
ncbi:MAG TPA: OsmC family protein [Vicinamibacterales bacterium]|nr:OsmC family protein [Vicinamibacterales bacterium]